MIWLRVHNRPSAQRAVRPSVFVPAETTRSPPIKRIASPVATRMALCLRSVRIRQWEICARPPPFGPPRIFQSSPAPCRQSLPLAPAQRRYVTTRVPPDAGDHHVCVPLMARQLLAGQVGDFDLGCRVLTRLALRVHEPNGQKPFTQRKILVGMTIDAIARLRPSSFLRARNRDAVRRTPQSPQGPSQTIVIGEHRLSGSGNSPLRRTTFFRRNGMELEHGCA